MRWISSAATLWKRCSIVVAALLYGGIILFRLSSAPLRLKQVNYWLLLYSPETHGFAMTLLRRCWDVMMSRKRWCDLVAPSCAAVLILVNCVKIFLCKIVGWGAMAYRLFQDRLADAFALYAHWTFAVSAKGIVAVRFWVTVEVGGGGRVGWGSAIWFVVCWICPESCKG